MTKLILSEEYEDIAFLRFDETETFHPTALDECFEEAHKYPKRFVIADFGQINYIDDEILQQFKKFAQGYLEDPYGKFCFVAQDKNTVEKIKNAFNGTFFKNFHNIGDAINYFYWECCKIRDVIRMKMPSDIGLVPSVRACISEFFSLCKIERKEAFHIEMIVDELCNNAIEHGTQDENRTIEVLCCANDEQIEINVYNGYSLRATKEKIGHDIEKDMKKWALSPSEHEDAFRGRGLGLVRNFSDGYEINSSTDGTWVHVIKKRGGSNAKNAD